MDDEKMPEMMDDDLEDLMFDDNELVSEEMSLSAVNENIERFMAVANVEAVFGEAVTQGDQVIIPAAEVGSFMGFGMGSGGGYSETESGGGGSGSGGGGGGWNFSRPVAVIVASPAGVRIEPIIDVTKVAIAALTTAGFMFGMLARMSRPRHR